MRIDDEHVRAIRKVWGEAQDTPAKRDTIEYLCDDLLDARAKLDEISGLAQMSRERIGSLFTDESDPHWGCVSELDIDAAIEGGH